MPTSTAISEGGDHLGRAVSRGSCSVRPQPSATRFPRSAHVRRQPSADQTDPVRGVVTVSAPTAHGDAVRQTLTERLVVPFIDLAIPTRPPLMSSACPEASPRAWTSPPSAAESGLRPGSSRLPRRGARTVDPRHLPRPNGRGVPGSFQGRTEQHGRFRRRGGSAAGMTALDQQPCLPRSRLVHRNRSTHSALVIPPDMPLLTARAPSPPLQGRRMGRNRRTRWLARNPADYVSLDVPNAFGILLKALEKAGARQQGDALATRAAAPPLWRLMRNHLPAGSVAGHRRIDTSRCAHSPDAC